MTYNLDFKDIKNAVDLVNQKIENGDYYRIESGIRPLDILKKGWSKGEFCIIGGRPGMGKTGFILSIISNLLDRNIPVSLFSAVDMMNEDFMTYLISCIKYQDYELVRKNKQEFLKSVDLSNLPLFLNIQPRLTLAYIRDNAKKLVEIHGIKCIFMESLQSIFNSEENGNEKEKMEYICHELKLIARDLNVPLIVTSDLNRSVEHREGINGKEPLLSDLRGSSAIEYEADSILMLHRPAYYGIYMDEHGNELHEFEYVKILKNKYGSIGDFILKYCYIDGTVDEVMDGKRTERKKQKNLHKNELIQKYNFELEVDNE